MDTPHRSFPRLGGLCLWAAATAVGAAPLPVPNADPVTTLASAVEWIDPLTESPRWSAMPELSEGLLLQATAGPARSLPSTVEKLGWTAAAPDPGLYALVGLGLLSLALVARSRRR
jgi:hypothetical protein